MSLKAAVPLLFAANFAACGGRVPPLVGPVPRPDPAAIIASIVLIGDAGEPARDSEPVLEAVRREIGSAGGRTTIVFLGDNIYPGGMPDTGASDLEEAERRLGMQLDVVRATGASGVVVPGNHDWANGGQDGWAAVQRQERYVRRVAPGRVVFAPSNGCPGPSVVNPAPGVRLILLDTQWWLHNGPRPEGVASGCPASSESEVIDSLRAALAGAGSGRAVVLAHHPLASGGPHSGHFDWKDHIFPLHNVVHWLWLPLPIIGSLYPVVRGAGVSPQDMPNGRNKAMRHAIERALAEHPPLIYASGHDHNLQVLKGTTADFLLVSGGGFYGRPYPVSPKRGTMFATSEKGFMRVDFLADGRVRLGVITVHGPADSAEEFSAWLADPASPGKGGAQ